MHVVDLEFAHRDFAAAYDAFRDEQSSFIFHHMLDSRGLMNHVLRQHGHFETMLLCFCALNMHQFCALDGSSHATFARVRSGLRDFVMQVCDGWNLRASVRGWLMIL